MIMGKEKMVPKDISIHTDASIKQAMETLSVTAQKVLLIVDEDQALIGTLTDGDIRRFILKGYDLSGAIQEVYNKNPIFSYQKDFNLEKIKKTLVQNKIALLPIVDQNRRVVDFVTWERAFENDREMKKQTLDAPVVIMAGGRGTRLEPFTKVLPKPLIPVGDKPIIEHIIDNFRIYGVREFFLTVHHQSKILRAYFEEKDPDYTIGFAEEDIPRGTASSLKLLNTTLQKPFFVSNCDIIIKADYNDLYRYHIDKGFDMTLVASTKKFDIPYGICELNSNGSLDGILEKPEYNFLVNTGMYILNPETIGLIPDDELFHITHLMEKVIKSGGEVGVYPVGENAWIDIGQWAEYRKAIKTIENI